MTALLSIWNNLPQEFTDKAILSFRKRLRSLRFCVATCCSWQTLWTLSLNIVTAVLLTFITDTFEVFAKKLCKVWFVIKKDLLNIQDATACSLKKWTLQSLNCCIYGNNMCYFSKICRVGLCVMNSPLLTLQIWWILWRTSTCASAIKTLSSSKWLGGRWPRWMPVEPQ